MFKETYGTMYYVEDMAKALAYYKGTLGLTPGYESKEWTEFPIGSHNICLHAKRSGETYTPNGVLIFKANGVKELHQKMQAEGVKVTKPHEVHPSAWTFHYFDNSGNEFSVYGEP